MGKGHTLREKLRISQEKKVEEPKPKRKRKSKLEK